MRVLKNIGLLAMLMLFAGKSFAQTDLNLYNMRYIPQSIYTNPASTPGFKINIGLPGISSLYGMYGNTGFALKDIVNPTADDSLELTIDNLIDQMQNRNLINFNFSVDLLHVGFRVNRNYFHLNVTEKFYSRTILPRDLIRFPWRGNGAFIGETADFSKLGVDAGHYREYGVGWAFDVMEGLTIGVKAKYLYGMENIRTERSDLTFATRGEDFALTANSDFLVNANFPTFMQVFGEDTLDEDFNAGNYLFGQGNHGFGADLGVVYDINDKWRVSASLLDLGFINWKANPRNFSQENFSFLFEGLNIETDTSEQVFDFDLVDSLAQELLDSIQDQFVIDSTGNSYNSPTIPRFHIGGNYQINETFDAGLLFTGELYKGTFRPAVTASMNMHLNHWLSASLAYTYAYNNPANLGFGFSINGGPVQLYMVSDNIIAPLIFQNTQYTTVRTGINLTIGKPNKDRDEDGIIDKEDDCPDTPGLAIYQGCPDTDGDSIPDIRDACPDIPGVPMHQGCPDRDNDGIVDSTDACPDDAGLAEYQGCPDRDGDTVIDKDDNCPDTPGLVEAQGCPDQDRDGVLDEDDACIDKPGLAENKGCPDSDGDGLFDHEDRCIDEFGPKDNFGCPYGDLDKDGVLDKEDRCPDTPGPAENSGCPYGDIDGDGVIDKDDECPNTPGTVENKGCPELQDDEKEILDQAFDNLEFQSGKSVIRSTSYESLDSLASLLKRKPDWKLRIAGHTDNVGAASTNLRLSKNRSFAVRDFLKNRGIAEDRFIVEWYGETKPLYPNNTAAGRQKNRRVEMEVVFE